MNEIQFQIDLLKDAELGTGLGSSSTDSLLPRDGDGWPVLPATHIKGLVRAALKEIAKERREWQDVNFPATGSTESKEESKQAEWPAPFLDTVFGAFDQETFDRETLFQFTDASIPRSNEKELPPDSRFVTRTAMNEKGVADEQTLRTTEAIGRGNKFRGTVYSKAEPGSVEDCAIRLGLASISAVGASRSRGGHCIVHFLKGDTCSEGQPGELLKELNQAIGEGRFAKGQEATQLPLADLTSSSKNAVEVELLFFADSPVCCPDHANKTNLLVSDFCIPASAVQGVVLHHINRQNKMLADQLFDSSLFRCWSLNPCWNPKHHEIDVAALLKPGADGALKTNRAFATLPLSTRVSLSHRVAKYSAAQDGEYTRNHFFDPAFAADPRDWTEYTEDAPLKAEDGVLLFGGQYEERRLWRAKDMPRKLTTHGVIDGAGDEASTGVQKNGRNLFSVEAMQPLVWRGMITVPEDVAEKLVESINQQRRFAVGKSRSVRGLGVMMARKLPVGAPVWDAPDEPVIVLQSPALIPEDLAAQIGEPAAESDEKESGSANNANDILREMVQRWCDANGLETSPMPDHLWPNVGIRFGWNRHHDAFQKAKPVFLPGTTFRLAASSTSKESLRKAILSGFTSQSDDVKAKQRGFGALAIHPGKAYALYHFESKPRPKEETSLFEMMKQMILLSEVAPLPSPSQIRAVEQRIRVDDTKSLEEARQYLERQCKRIVQVYFDWKDIHATIDLMLRKNTPEVAKAGLVTLSELSMAKNRRGATSAGTELKGGV